LPDKKGAPKDHRFSTVARRPRPETSVGSLLRRLFQWRASAQGVFSLSGADPASRRDFFLGASKPRPARATRQGAPRPSPREGAPCLHGHKSLQQRERLAASKVALHCVGKDLAACAGGCRSRRGALPTLAPRFSKGGGALPGRTTRLSTQRRPCVPRDGPFPREGGPCLYGHCASPPKQRPCRASKERHRPNKDFARAETAPLHTNKNLARE
jgi:hypothetical protein